MACCSGVRRMLLRCERQQGSEVDTRQQWYVRLLPCGMMQPTKHGIDMTPISYYPRYTINYTFDVSAITSVKVGVITTPSCLFFYGVYQNDARPQSLSVCSSFPTYGRQEGAAGDELGHLAGMSYCYTADNHDGQVYLVKKGHNGSAHRADSHWNPLYVMAYMYMSYKGTGDEAVSA